MADNKDEQARQSPFMPMFEHFRSELDEHHDRRERIIKASRDVTAASKKIIFTLQRVRKLKQPLPPHVDKSNKPFYDTIKAQLSNVAGDLQGVNSHRYARQISGGCQEYMEAALFQHYLTTASLPSYPEAARDVQRLSTATDGSNVAGVDLTHQDYVLGMYDLTGELMRFAITAMATDGAVPALPADDAEAGGKQRSVLDDLRALRAALENLEVGDGPFAKEVGKKMDVMRASVEKVERALYGLTVRGAERPKGWMPDMPTVEVEG